MTDSNATVDVLVIDDHPVVNRAVAAVLKATPGFSVRTAAAGQEALTLTHNKEPDVALCDLSLGSGMSGLELIEQLHAQYPDVAIVVFSSHTESEKVHAALEAGAIGYVAKATDPRELPGMLKAAAAGDTVFDPKTSRTVLNLVKSAWNPPPKGELSLRELEVLTTLCHEGGTTKEIAELLHMQTSTANSHLQSLFRKLGVSGKGAAVKEAYRLGLVSRPDV